MPKEDGQGHSSYLVWLIYAFRGIERILPNLKQKPKHGWVAPFFLSLLVLLAALGMGIYIDGYGIHPPAHFEGICPAPAQIRGGGCIIISVQVETVSGTTTVITQTQQAGYVLTTTTTTSSSSR